MEAIIFWRAIRRFCSEMMMRGKRKVWQGVGWRILGVLIGFGLFFAVFQETGYSQDAVKDKGLPGAKGLGRVLSAVGAGAKTFVDQLTGAPTTPRQAPPAPVGQRFPPGVPQPCIDAVQQAAGGGPINPLRINYPNGNVGTPNAEQVLGGLGPQELASRMAAAAERVFFVKDSISPQGSERKIEHLKTEDGGGLFAAMNIGPGGLDPHQDVEMALQRVGDHRVMQGRNGAPVTNDFGNELLNASGYRWRLRDPRLANSQAVDGARCDSCHSSVNGNPNNTQKHAIKVEPEQLMSMQDVADLCRRLMASGEQQKLMFLLTNLRSGKVKFRDSVFEQVDTDGDGIPDEDGRQLQSDESLQQELGFGQDTPPVNNTPQIPNIPIPPLGGGQQSSSSSSPSPSPSPSPTVTPSPSPSPVASPTPEPSPGSSESPSPSPTASGDSDSYSDETPQPSPSLSPDTQSDSGYRPPRRPRPRAWHPRWRERIRARLEGREPMFPRNHVQSSGSAEGNQVEDNSSSELKRRTRPSTGRRSRETAEQNKLGSFEKWTPKLPPTPPPRRTPLLVPSF